MYLPSIENGSQTFSYKVKINNIRQYQHGFTSLWYYIHMHILYSLTHTTTGPLDTLHKFSTTVKGKNRWKKERKMKDGDYDMKQNMCSFLLTARTSSL